MVDIDIYNLVCRFICYIQLQKYNVMVLCVQIKCHFYTIWVRCTCNFTDYIHIMTIHKGMVYIMLMYMDIDRQTDSQTEIYMQIDI